MFTGIVEELGHLISRHDDRFRIGARTVLDGARIGDSTAVNGCCLTVIAVGDGWFDAEVTEETLERTNLADLAPGEPVNLERPVRLEDRLGGHLVQGHVDGVGTIAAAAPDLRVDRAARRCSATSSRRDRSPSTASASPSSSRRRTASPSR